MSKTPAERQAKYRNSDAGKAYRESWWAAHPDKRSEYNETTKATRRAQARQKYVYRWISPEGFTAYVGRGVMQRAVSHQKGSPWWKPGMTLSTLKARNEWHAMKLEGLWGELFQPRFNAEGYRDLPNWQEKVSYSNGL